jgi:hypothetical protein
MSDRDHLKERLMQSVKHLAVIKDLWGEGSLKSEKTPVLVIRRRSLSWSSLCAYSKNKATRVVKGSNTHLETGVFGAVFIHVFLRFRHQQSVMTDRTLYARLSGGGLTGVYLL